MKYKAIVLIFVGMVVMLATANSVSATSIKVAPMKYEEKLTPGIVMTGAIDLSNPSDSKQKFSARVLAFRQINENGELQFYSDDKISAGINVDLAEIELGPHQVARVFFSINPDKLPRTGIYASVQFSTNPGQPETATRLASSVATGTLLILDNSRKSIQEGSVVDIDSDFWQIGEKINVGVTYKNTASGDEAIAFSPILGFRALPWGGKSSYTGPLVFSGNQRSFSFQQSSNYIGFLPLQVSDSQSGLTKTKWVFAVTGLWVYLLPTLLFVLAVLAALVYRWRIKATEQEY